MIDLVIISLACGTPEVHETAWIAPNATVIGQVRLGANVSIWYGSVLRADNDVIEVGEGSNIQDNTSIHVDEGRPVQIGARVSVGHNAVIHGATIGDDVMVGLGARLLNNCVIGEGSFIGAGAIVREGAVIPPRSLVVGAPGQVIREVDDALLQRILRNSIAYANLAKQHREGRVV